MVEERCYQSAVLPQGRRPGTESIAPVTGGASDTKVRAPHEVALEEAFCGKSVQSALRIGEARGVVLATAHRSGLVVHQYPPARIKRRVAGHGAASKEAVSRMAVQALGVAGIDGPADATDAVAVALCRVEERRAVTFGRV